MSPNFHFHVKYFLGPIALSNLTIKYVIAIGPFFYSTYLIFRYSFFFFWNKYAEVRRQFLKRKKKNGPIAMSNLTIKYVIAIGPFFFNSTFFDFS